MGLRLDDDNVANDSSTSPNDSGTGAVEGGLQQVEALSASKPVGESDAIHKDERKNKNAVDFLKEVGLHVTQHSNYIIFLSAFFLLLPPIEVQIVHLVFLISCKDCHFGLVV